MSRLCRSGPGPASVLCWVIIRCLRKTSRASRGYRGNKQGQGKAGCHLQDEGCTREVPTSRGNNMSLPWSEWLLDIQVLHEHRAGQTPRKEIHRSPFVLVASEALDSQENVPKAPNRLLTLALAFNWTEILLKPNIVKTAFLFRHSLPPTTLCIYICLHAHVCVCVCMG